MWSDISSSTLRIFPLSIPLHSPLCASSLRLAVVNVRIPSPNSPPMLSLLHRNSMIPSLREDSGSPAAEALRLPPQLNTGEKGVAKANLLFVLIGLSYLERERANFVD
jgi:hypothetical protein